MRLSLKGPLVVIDAKLKSRFIFPAFGALVLILIASVILAVLNPDERVAWMGAAIAALPFPVFVGLLIKRPRPRTSENLPLLLFICAIGVMLPLWEQFIEGTSGWPASVTALSAGVLFLAYVFWYSPFGRFESPQLMVGGKLPEFSLPDIDGNTFESSSLIGSPAVVLFYRGNWCPFCMAQIDEIAERYKEMESMGIKVVLISPQPEKYSKDLAERLEIPATMLVDKGSAVAESLGLAIKNAIPLGIKGDYDPDSVMPTVVVTNENGTILFSDQTDNYRVRPEPDMFLAILRRSGVKPA